MLLGTLGATLLRNILARKGIARAVYGNENNGVYSRDNLFKIKD